MIHVVDVFETYKCGYVHGKNTYVNPQFQRAELNNNVKIVETALRAIKVTKNAISRY